MKLSQIQWVVISLFTWILGNSACTPPPSKILAQVGEISITENQLLTAKKIKALEAQKNVQISTDTLMDSLIEVRIKIKILEKYGFSISTASLLEEAKRIELQSQRPELIAAVKATLPDQESYLQNFILPIYVDRALYFDFFANHPDIHKESRLAAEKIMTELQTHPKSIQKLAKQGSYLLARINIPEQPKSKTGFDFSLPPEPHVKLPPGYKGPEPTDEQKTWIINSILNYKKNHKIEPTLLPETEYWQILVYDSEGVYANKKTHRLDILTVKKIPFDQWYEKEKNQITVVKSILR